jgi:hypothetical protein
MSDSLPENSFSGILRVVKLITGEELIGMVCEAMPDKVTIKLPAKMELYNSKDPDGNIVEYVKLTNYLSSIKGYEISISRTAILYIGQPALDLEKMYEIYFMAMQNDPSTIISSMPEGHESVESGLKLLNDLFNNEDFVDFVNELIENFEGVEILTELEDDGEENESDSFIEPLPEDEPEPKPAKRKRNKAKPEGRKLPYKPDSPPEDPESWSDNPEDYI